MLISACTSHRHLQVFDAARKSFSLVEAESDLVTPIANRPVIEEHKS